MRSLGEIEQQVKSRDGASRILSSFSPTHFPLPGQELQRCQPSSLPSTPLLSPSRPELRRASPLLSPCLHPVSLPQPSRAVTVQAVMRRTSVVSRQPRSAPFAPHPALSLIRLATAPLRPLPLSPPNYLRPHDLGLLVYMKGRWAFWPYCLITVSALSIRHGG